MGYKRPPDIVVNSAGITKDGFLLRMKEEDFEQVIDVNLKGTFLVTQAAASLMKEQQLGGSIVNIASIVGKTGNIGQANYTASKAGVIGFTKTAMTDVVPDKVKTGILSQIPLGDFGDPIDIAEATAFLACERSKYITGASFDVNGGMA